MPSLHGVKAKNATLSSSVRSLKPCLILDATTMPRLTALWFANPNGFKSISSGLAVRAGQARSANPGKPFPKFINSEGVGACARPPKSTAAPMQLLQSCSPCDPSPSVVAARQRWAECCNRVAVGRAELLLRLGFGRRSTVALPDRNAAELMSSGRESFSCCLSPCRLQLRAWSRGNVRRRAIRHRQRG